MSHGHSHGSGAGECGHSHGGHSHGGHSHDDGQQNMQQLDGIEISHAQLAAAAKANAAMSMLQGQGFGNFGTVHEAVSNALPQDFAKMLMMNPDSVNARGWSGLTPMHRAAIRGEPPIINILCHMGADINARNDFEETPLMFACRAGKVHIVHFLLDLGADLTMVDKAGKGAMLHACMGGSVPVIHYLHEVRGIPFNVHSEQEEYPVHLLAQHGHVDAFSYILRKERCDIFQNDKSNNSVMHHAVKGGRDDICWALLEKGGCRMLHMRNDKGLCPLDEEKEAKPDFTHQQLVKKLKPYTEMDKTYRPRAPVLWWYWSLIMPFTMIAGLVMLARMLGINQGLIMFLGVLVLGYKVWMAGHRLPHLSRVANPTYLGLYFGGQLHMAICIFSELVPATYRSHGGVFWATVALVPIYIYLVGKMIISDPGRVRESVKKEGTGERASIRDVAMGIVRLDRFCIHCEIIQPAKTKHCKLCNYCIQGADHHCLFMMKCIGRNNHCHFVYFILFSIVSAVMFYVNVSLYAWKVFPDKDLFTSILLLFDSDAMIACSIFLAACCLGVGIYVLYYQYETVSKGETWIFFSKAPVHGLTGAEQFLNIVYFLAGKHAYKTDPFYDIESSPSDPTDY
ncbi:putative ZDHHC-type palmitoyltransferase 6 [Lineus longissimus]|uniref:putative ZDHHC-type palmitoyltransferase 6 n=1 Tax=Lineus longissimus TaxID=88925 RepID=UPI002B4E9C77